MQIILDNGKTVRISELSFTGWRRFMAEFLASNKHSGQAWDVMSCIRGPDHPSERPYMASSESVNAYRARRERKRKTVEPIREAMFYGTLGGAARHHSSNHVELPPRQQWDHFDRHVERAALILDLVVKVPNE